MPLDRLLLKLIEHCFLTTFDIVNYGVNLIDKVDFRPYQVLPTVVYFDFNHFLELFQFFKHFIFIHKSSYSKSFFALSKYSQKRASWISLQSASYFLLG